MGEADVEPQGEVQPKNDNVSRLAAGFDKFRDAAEYRSETFQARQNGSQIVCKTHVSQELRVRRGELVAPPMAVAHRSDRTESSGERNRLDERVRAPTEHDRSSRRIMDVSATESSESGSHISRL
jgi:hypothetical protein